ncbi:MAG: hypothetical protein ABEH43_03640 [Flavobacteriales bacterium]
MSDSRCEFEQTGLTQGNKVFVFDLCENDASQKNEFLSLICSNFISTDLVNLISNESNLSENLTVFCPQFTPDGADSNFSRNRKGLFSDTVGQNVDIITLNWAKGTKIRDSSTEIKYPFSAYFKHFPYDWRNYHRELRVDNHKNGGFFTRAEEEKYDIWFSPVSEHSKLFTYKKTYKSPGNQQSTSHSKEYIAQKLFEFSGSSSDWVQTEYNHELELRRFMNQQISQEYEYPLKCDPDFADYFFGLCFGTSEEDELTANDEWVERLIVDSGDETLDIREDKRDLFLEMIDRLSNLHFPEYFPTAMFQSHEFYIHDSDQNGNRDTQVIENYPIYGNLRSTKDGVNEIALISIIDSSSGKDATDILNRYKEACRHINLNEKRICLYVGSLGYDNWKPFPSIDDPETDLASSQDDVGRSDRNEINFGSEGP